MKQQQHKQQKPEQNCSYVFLLLDTNIAAYPALLFGSIAGVFSGYLKAELLLFLQIELFTKLKPTFGLDQKSHDEASTCRMFSKNVLLQKKLHLKFHSTSQLYWYFETPVIPQCGKRVHGKTRKSTD